MDECIEEEKNKRKQEKKDGLPSFTSSQEFNNVIHENEKVPAQDSFGRDFDKTTQQIDEILNRPPGVKKTFTHEDSQIDLPKHSVPSQEFKENTYNSPSQPSQETTGEIKDSGDITPPSQQNIVQKPNDQPKEFNEKIDQTLERAPNPHDQDLKPKVSITKSPDNAINWFKSEQKF